MATVVGSFLLAALVLWLGVVIWALRDGEWRQLFALETVRASWRPALLAWLGCIGLPLFVAYLGARGELTLGGAVLAGVAWLAFALLLWWVRRPPARRDGAGDGTPTPS